MTEWGRAEVARAVQVRLRSREKYGRTVRVDTDSVDQGDPGATWWLVPVVYQEYPPHAYQFFEMFADIEDELRRDDQLDVLLVPSRLPPDPSWPLET